jgi:transcriptional pleiotropic regulator of transition state genes
MKATGIVRPVDQLGRIVIPAELRRTMGIGDHDPLEIFVKGEDIVLRKYQPGCAFCGETDPQKIKIVGMYGKIICRSCTSHIINANISVDLAAAEAERLKEVREKGVKA